MRRIFFGWAEQITNFRKSHLNLTILAVFSQHVRRAVAPIGRLLLIQNFTRPSILTVASGIAVNHCSKDKHFLASHRQNQSKFGNEGKCLKLPINTYWWCSCLRPTRRGTRSAVLPSPPDTDTRGRSVPPRGVPRESTPLRSCRSHTCTGQPLQSHWLELVKFSQEFRSIDWVNLKKGRSLSAPQAGVDVGITVAKVHSAHS